MKKIKCYQFDFLKNGQKCSGGFTFNDGEDVIERADKLAGELGAEFWWNGRVICQ